MSPTPNTTELVAIYQHIKANPETWQQRMYASKTACGTAYCFAGWAIARAGGEPVGWRKDLYESPPWTAWAEFAEMPDGRMVDMDEEARTLLGLSEEQSGDLFAAWNELNDLRNVIAAITGVDPEQPGGAS